MKAKRFFSAVAIAFGVLALVATTSCSKNEPSSDLTLSKTSVTVEVGKAGVSVTAKYGSEDVTSKATWTSADTKVATVAGGVITAVKKGSTTVTCTYESKTATVAVTVTGGSSTGDSRLDGSNYILINMADAQASIISSKIDADLRVNGEYGDGGAIVPAGADCVCQIWNPSAEIGQNPNTGTNSFGTSDSWFGTMSNSPLQSGWWGNICGGNLLTNLNGKYSEISKITSDHVFCIALKGTYTAIKPMEIGMKMNGNEKWFLKITENTGEDYDGSWGIYNVPASDIFDFSQPVTGEEFFTLMFRATGSGVKVDIDAAFFYIPAE